MPKDKPIELCTLQQAQEMIEATNGRVFAVDVVTRGTGEVRTGRFRTGCTKDTNGGGARYDAAEHGLKRVYRMAGDKSSRPGKWRSLNLSGIVGLRTGGRSFRVSG